MPKIFLSIFAVLGLLLPAAVLALGETVVINEIAWMGTKANSADEWLELYNPTDAEVDLSGWKLYEAGGNTLIITLSRKILAKGYFLIERSDDSTISDIAADLFGSFGGSGLNNGGEYLVLKNADGLTIDSLDASSGWPAGDNTTKASMERKPDGSWQTNDGITKNGRDAAGNTVMGTPRAANSAVSAAGSGPATATSTPPEPSAPAPSAAGGGSVSSGGAAAASSSGPLSASAGSDFAVEAGGEVSLSARGSQGASGYKWYLGDGSVKEGLSVSHRYQFPGTYLVTLEASNGREISLDQLKVYVFGGKVLINEFLPQPLKGEQWLELYNPGRVDLDLGGWVLESDVQSFTLPSFTIIPAGGFLVLTQSASQLDLSRSKNVKMRWPNGLVVEEVGFSAVPPGKSANRTNDGFLWQDTPTPGAPNTLAGSGGVNDGALGSRASVVLFPDKISAPPNPITGLAAAGATYGQAGLVSAAGGSFWDKLFSTLWFWVGSVAVLGVMVGVFYLWLRMKHTNNFFDDAASTTKIKK